MSFEAGIKMAGLNLNVAVFLSPQCVYLIIRKLVFDETIIDCPRLLAKSAAV